VVSNIYIYIYLWKAICFKAKIVYTISNLITKTRMLITINYNGYNGIIG
jgi:hypothetical protein